MAIGGEAWVKSLGILGLTETGLPKTLRVGLGQPFRDVLAALSQI
jgi:hypothetical protein